jgi:peptidoglycan-associated lipoprotein
MRLNKVMKSLAIALPLFALGACSSSSDTDAQSQVDTNAAQTAQDNANAQALAAQREAEIKEREAQAEMDRLRAEHIVYFDFDVSTLSGEFSAMLDAHAKFLNANSDVKVVVEGHADERGTPEYNIALGERRAQAVVT